MLKVKIKATSLANLTDVRYFAAWGVDYIGCPLDGDTGISIEDFKQFCDWVEGPRFIGEFDSRPIDEIQALCKELNLSGIQVNSTVELNFNTEELTVFRKWGNLNELDPVKYPADFHLICFENPDELDLDALEKSLKLNDGQNIFLDISSLQINIETLNAMNFAGYSLQGGEEEKVGLKSYDELDEIFEVLEVE